jgi:Xaa-Pro aminopeptidase
LPLPISRFCPDLVRRARRAQEAAIAHMVAGNPLFSIDAAREVIEQAGYG